MTRRKTIRKTTRTTTCVTLSFSLFLACGSRPRQAVAPPPPAPLAAAATAQPVIKRGRKPDPAPSIADEGSLVEEAPEANPRSETVTIKLVAEASRKARVFWGRKDLGFAPLELQRPRGSGPLDLLVIAPGALPLHTRVFSDRDDKLALRLVAESDAPSMLGYHAPEEPSAAPKVVNPKRAPSSAPPRAPTPR